MGKVRGRGTELYRRTRMVILWAVILVALLPQAHLVAGQEVTLDSEQKERFNIFLSNFSEVLLPPFANGAISDQELIRFGILHTWANNPALITRSGAGEYMAAAVVDQAAVKYFGMSIGRHQAAAPGAEYVFDYRDGTYYREPSFFPAFAGQRFAVAIYFTQLTKLIAHEGDYYTAYGDVYVKEPQSVQFHSIYRPLEQWNNLMLSTIQPVGPVKATIRRVTDDEGRQRYILIEYHHI